MSFLAIASGIRVSAQTQTPVRALRTVPAGNTLFHSFKARFLLAASLLLIACSATAQAQQVTLAWDPAADATGYRLAWGVAPGQYDRELDVGAVTTATVTGLEFNRTYYFVVRAYNTTGVSDPSNAVSTFLPAPVLGFDGTGRPNLLWQNAATGSLVVWSMGGFALASASWLSPVAVADPAWKAIAAADLDRDGRLDVLWQHAVTGGLVAWIMNGTTLAQGRWLSPSGVSDTRWRVAAVADFDLDGYVDFLWQHSQDGSLVAWLMQATNLKQARWLTPNAASDPAWRVVDTGDFDLNGRPDILWQHSVDATLVVWFMDGLQLVRGQYLTPSGVPDRQWRVKAVVDVDQDGRVDLVWQHRVTGELACWRLDGTTLVQGVLLSPSAVADRNWQIVAGR